MHAQVRHLPRSHHISPNLLTSPQISSHLPRSPHISPDLLTFPQIPSYLPQLPLPPHISPCLSHLHPSRHACTEEIARLEGAAEMLSVLAPANDDMRQLVGETVGGMLGVMEAERERLREAEQDSVSRTRKELREQMARDADSSKAQQQALQQKANMSESEMREALASVQRELKNEEARRRQDAEAHAVEMDRLRAEKQVRTSPQISPRSPPDLPQIPLLRRPSLTYWRVRAGEQVAEQNVKKAAAGQRADVTAELKKAEASVKNERIEVRRANPTLPLTLRAPLHGHRQPLRAPLPGHRQPLRAPLQCHSHGLSD